jgi:hypothetical protein
MCLVSLRRHAAANAAHRGVNVFTGIAIARMQQRQHLYYHVVFSGDFEAFQCTGSVTPRIALSMHGTKKYLV